MHVGLTGPGHVQPPGCHVRGYVEIGAAAGEPVQVLQALLLVQLGVEGEGGHVQQGEQVGQPPHAVDAVAEDDYSPWGVFTK